jgi:hypothetical protein
MARAARLYAPRDPRIYRRLPLKSTVMALLAAPLLIVRTLWRCRRQTQRWPWADNEQYMHVPLAVLRSAFGIRVPHLHADSR